MNQSMNNEREKAAEAFQRLYDIVVRLRSPGGCPWDREQTPETLRSTLIEETYETVEAINEGDAEHVKEELGDLFLQPVMISHMEEEAGAFVLSDVLNGICDKLVRRHPHVFGEVQVKDSAEVLVNWDRIKTEQEGRKPLNSILDSVSKGMPPLDRARKLSKKAAKAGFDWKCWEEVAEKLNEELDEVKEAIAEGDQAHIEEELGDVFFVAVNLCRFLKVDPSVALARSNEKFTRRFNYVEKRLKDSGLELSSAGLDAMTQAWNEAKKAESP
jgi:tetrapyrrole methylase family protein/MazG family protein